MSNDSERRVQPRKLLVAPMTLELFVPAVDQENRAAVATGVDISSGGLGIATQHDVRPGEIVKLGYPLVGEEVVLPVYSEVVWNRSDTGERRAGLRFLH